jgi:cyclohexyl-isocyanide hydratase
MFAAAQLETVLVWKDRDPIDLGRGVRIVPDTTFDWLQAADVLFVPGGAGICNASAEPDALAFLRSRAETAQYITSVCTGALVLGAAGLLRGYRATTHWRFLDLLPPLGAQPVQERVVHDRNRITGGGVTAGLDFGLTIIAQLCGTGWAEGVQLGLEYQPAPPFSSGTPHTARPEIVRAYERMSQSLYDARVDLLRPFSDSGQTYDARSCHKPPLI